MLAFELVLVELVGAVPPHPSETTTEIKNMNSAGLLSINLKNNVPIWRLRPNEGSDGGQTGTGRSIYSKATVRGTAAQIGIIFASKKLSIHL